MPRFGGGRREVIVRTVLALRALRTGRPTLAQLAGEMGTSERTARRYIESIEDAYIPVKRYGPHYRIEGQL